MSPDRSERASHSSGAGDTEPPARRRRGARSEQPPRFLVFNQRDQPVELHTASGVFVVGPHSEVELGETDLDSPQIRTLQQRRQINVRPAQSTASDETDED